MYAGFHGWAEHKNSCELCWLASKCSLVWRLCQGVEIMLNDCPNLETPLPLTILVVSSEMYAGHSLIHSIHVLCCLRCIRSTCPFQQARFPDDAGCGDIQCLACDNNDLSELLHLGATQAPHLGPKKCDGSDPKLEDCLNPAACLDREMIALIADYPHR